MKNHNTHEKQVRNRLERKYKIRRAGALIGILLMAATAKLGIDGLNSAPNDDKYEIEGIGSISNKESNLSFRVFDGEVSIIKNANIRENPMVTEDKSGTLPNLVNAKDLFEGFNENAIINIKNPIVAPDEVNPANGVWYGFKVKKTTEEGFNTYWVNGQNIEINTKRLQFKDSLDTQDIGVVILEKNATSY